MPNLINLSTRPFIQLRSVGPPKNLASSDKVEGSSKVNTAIFMTPKTYIEEAMKNRGYKTQVEKALNNDLLPCPFSAFISHYFAEIMPSNAMVQAGINFGISLARI